MMTQCIKVETFEALGHPALVVTSWYIGSCHLKGKVLIHGEVSGKSILEILRYKLDT